MILGVTLIHFGTCIIDVYFEGPSYLGVELPGAHTFIVASDNTGNLPPVEFRAGGNESGLLNAETSPLAGAQDRPSDAFFKLNLVHNECKCTPYVLSLIQTARQINSAQIPYRWTSTNSNAAVTTAIQNLGTPYPPASSIPWWVKPLPGWGHPLGVPAPTGRACPCQE